MRARTLAAVVLAGLLGLVMAGPLVAQTGQASEAAASTVPEAPAPAVEEIEIIDTGDDAPAGPGPAGFWDFVGRLHHGVVHLPIGWLLLMVLLDIAAFGFNRRAAEDVGLWTLGLTVLSFVPGIVTGMLRAAHLREAPEIAVLVGQHQAMIFITFGLAALAFGVRWLNRERLVGAVRGAYLTLIGLAAGLMLVAGHWGGRIVFGPDFLGF